MRRDDVEFEAEGGVKLRGWLLSPDGPGPHPAITMAHGYERAHEPKRLALIPGGHFDAYLSSFPQASRAALHWFGEHLS